MQLISKTHMHSWSSHPVTMQRAVNNHRAKEQNTCEDIYLGATAAAEPSTHPTPFPNQPDLGVELPRHPGHVPLSHLDGYLSATGSGEYRVEERKTNVTQLALLSKEPQETLLALQPTGP